jgi:hypothetical protein
MKGISFLCNFGNPLQEHMACWSRGPHWYFCLFWAILTSKIVTFSTIIFAGRCLRQSTSSREVCVLQPNSCANFVALPLPFSICVHGHKAVPLWDIPRWNKPMNSHKFSWIQIFFMTPYTLVQLTLSNKHWILAEFLKLFKSTCPIVSKRYFTYPVLVVTWLSVTNCVLYT